MSNKKAVLIIDGYGFIFRAYHVQPPLTSPKGLPVGAVYGFTAMLIKLLNDFKPTHAVVVFDSGKPNFRHQLYAQYKANRPSMPPELVGQLELLRRASSSLNFPVIEKVGYEADDIIATLATNLAESGEEVVIVSSDKDLMQLVSEQVKIYDPLKSKYVSSQDVIDKFGVAPQKVRDVMALTGDRSDNIPGIGGIGPKTAASLINQFGSLDKLFKSTEQIKNQRHKQLVEAGRESALISWQLVGLDKKVELEIDLNSLRWQPPTAHEISSFLIEYGFKSLYKRVENLLQLKILEGENETAYVPTPSHLIEIQSPNELEVVLQKVADKGVVSLLFATGKDQISSLNLLIKEEGCLIHFSLKEEGKVAPADCWFLPYLVKLLQDRSIKKLTFGLKILLKLCEVGGRPAAFQAVEDIELMQYSLSAGLPQVSMEIYSLPKAYELLLAKLREEHLLGLYRDIDLPLCYVLHQIENNGVKLNLERLRELSKEFGEQIAALEEQIFAVCEASFNIASPKQLADILFIKMQLPFGKLSSKTKAYSTSSEVLEKLSEDGYPIADLLLQWRHLTKLKNTYTDSLPAHVSRATNRVHTKLLQTSTTTGRLSSMEPNLQNIPIHSLEGNKIRGAFIVEEGCKLISADYSQIELRILSHIANITTFKDAFLKDEDIHSRTACQVFKISPSELTPEHRRKAKAINFGIIYGISGFGLAKQLNISPAEAAIYIKNYFKEYPGIFEYMERTKEYARKYGYVKNLLGRKCFLPLIQDKKPAVRHFAERAAINAPVQSASADIIKIAMIKLDKAFNEKGLHTKIILQIHDELLFEAPHAEVEQVSSIIKSIMENSLSLSVPLVVEVKSGNSWLEIH